MTPELRATFRKPFAEQVAAFRLRLAQLQPTAKWIDLWQSQHDRAFMVAGAMKAELLADLAAAVDKAVSQGTSMQEFARDFRTIVAKHGWHGWTGEGSKRGEAWRTKVIYKTNMATSYAAGRWAQIKGAGFAFIVYRHGASVDPRIEHLGWDGLILPADHPFWSTHAPPNGWGCSCYVAGARSESGAVRLGGKPGKRLPDGWDKIDKDTGLLPGIDKGWAYAPGDTVVEAINALTGKLPKLPPEIGASMFLKTARERELDALCEQWSAFVDEALATYVQQRVMVIGALKPSWVGQIKAAGIDLKSAEIAVSDKMVVHTFRGTNAIDIPSTRTSNAKPKIDPVDLDWYRLLPRNVRSPNAVLLDERNPPATLLLIYETEDALARLAISLNVTVGKDSKVRNSVASARVVSVNDLRSDLNQKKVTKLEGDL